MSTHKLDHIVDAAVEAGLLPAGARSAVSRDGRPWPLLLLTALGAWLSAIPFVLMFWEIFGRQLERGPVPYILGIAVLAGAVSVLRSKKIPLFVEQLAVPGLLVGALMLGLGLANDIRFANASAVLALVAALVAWIVPRTWLRVLLGVAMGGLLSIALSSLFSEWYHKHHSQWLAWQSIIGLWLLAFAAERHMPSGGGPISTMAALEAISIGIAVAALGGVAIFSGPGFLVGGLVYSQSGFDGSAFGPSLIMQLLSVGCTLVAAGWMARQWAALRTWWYALVALPIAALAWFNASLGAVLLVLALSLTTGRRGIACFAAVCAIWLIGSFYYLLHWPLGTKAVVLAAIGAIIGLLARYAVPGEAIPTLVKPIPVAGGSRGSATAIVSCGVLVLVVANAAIWQKESLIKNGQPVFVELAPVDPRSLMQGDFMRLNFAVPELQSSHTPKVIARRDGRGVATLLPVDKVTSLKPGDLQIELVRKDHRWILVTDAWFFAEGEAGRWSKARYGEFRVDGSGRALLVGLRGPNLEPL